jgi:hypothetical protein
MLSVFVQPVWWIPLLAVPGYWIVGLFIQTPYFVDIDRIIKEPGWYEDQCGKFGMLRIPIYEGLFTMCCGISKYTKYISCCFNKQSNESIKTSISHELSHLHYNHPLINIIYFTVCCICSASCLYLNSVMAMIFVVGIIPLTIWKTMQMEITADRLADSFSDMRALLKTHPDDSIRKMRLAALDGKRS